MHDASASPQADRFRQSLLLLGVVVAIALVGLATDGNWQKARRVGAAALIYAGVLLALSHRGIDEGGRRRWWWFAAAGVAAGVASGLLRPEPDAASIAIDAGAGTVLAIMHAMGLDLSEKVRRKITA